MIRINRSFCCCCLLLYTTYIHTKRATRRVRLATYGMPLVVDGERERERDFEVPPTSPRSSFSMILQVSRSAGRTDGRRRLTDIACWTYIIYHGTFSFGERGYDHCVGVSSDFNPPSSERERGREISVPPPPRRRRRRSYPTCRIFVHAIEI